jgi:hypothetical protein
VARPFQLSVVHRLVETGDPVSWRLIEALAPSSSSGRSLSVRTLWSASLEAEWSPAAMITDVLLRREGNESLWHMRPLAGA